MIYVFCTQKTYKTAIYLFWALCLLVKAYKFGDCEAFFYCYYYTTPIFF